MEPIWNSNREEFYFSFFYYAYDWQNNLPVGPGVQAPPFRLEEETSNFWMAIETMFTHENKRETVNFDEKPPNRGQNSSHCELWQVTREVGDRCKMALSSVHQDFNDCAVSNTGRKQIIIT